MKEVTLNIRSMQNGKETSNIYTVASMKKCRESYDFVFDSPDEKTFDAKKLRLSLFRDGLSLCADGTSKLADMVLEKGKKQRAEALGLRCRSIVCHRQGLLFPYFTRGQSRRQ